MKNLAAVLFLLVACKHDEDYKKQKPPEPEEKAEASKPPPPPKPERKALKPEEMGECKLTVTGAIKAEQTTPGGQAATNISYWRSEQERAGMMGVDGFVVNCFGPEVRFSMTPGGGKKDGMPFAPKKYEFKAGKGDAGLNITFEGGKTTVDAPSGYIDVTAFDKRHIAGTIDLSGKTMPGKKPIKITGKFDLMCPNFAGCEL